MLLLGMKDIKKKIRNKQTRSDRHDLDAQNVDHRAHGDDGPADRVIQFIAEADLILQVGGAEYDVQRGVDKQGE